MDMMLSKHFEKMINNYAIIKDGHYKNKFSISEQNELKKELFLIISEVVGSSVLKKYKICIKEGINEHKGLEIYIWDERYCDSSFNEGIYIFFSFNNSRPSLRVSVEQGHTYPFLRDRITIAKKIRSSNSKVLYGFRKKNRFYVGHEDSIIAQWYVSIPSEKVFVNDLKRIFSVYFTYAHSYFYEIKKLEDKRLSENVIREEEVDNYNDVVDFDVDFKAPTFYDFLVGKGYFFSKQTIENYLLSLKVKPFVILTGNSGTGKTKLSQLFAEYYLVYKSFLKLENCSQNDSNFVSINVTANESSFKDTGDKGINKNPGWTLKANAEDFNDFISFEKIIGEYDAKIGDISFKTKIFFNSKLFYSRDCIEFKKFFERIFNETGGEKEVTLKINYNDILSCIKPNFIHSDEIKLRLNNPSIAKYSNCKSLTTQFLDYIPLKNGKCKIYTSDFKYSAKANFDFDFKIRIPKNENITKYFKSINENTYNLTIKGFKNKFNELCAIIPVGANWTDNRNVVGYYNVLTKSYQHTQSLNLILQAKKELNVPYFLILDEMNLSHVERYFSDFLSSMESKKPIPLHKEDNVVDAPEELSIPNNVFIIGTVNIDETTYMFSPKVLDRANVLEFKTFEELSVIDYIVNNSPIIEFNGDVNYLENPLSDINLKDNIIDIVNDKFSNVHYILENILEDNGTKEIITTDINLLNNIIGELSTFNDYLSGSSFEFGYRTVNEILAFMVVAWKYEGEKEIWDNWRRYFDAQILQKILPKLHGSQTVLGKTLDNLLAHCLGIESIDEIDDLSDINLDEFNPPYIESAKKLIQMKNVLEKQRYVSFIS